MRRPAWRRIEAGEALSPSEATRSSGTRLATGRADPRSFHVRHRVAFRRRQAHVHPDVLAPALHPQRLLAEERRSHLAGDVVERDAERVRLGAQPDPNLLDAGGVVRPYVEDALQLAQVRDDVAGERRQPIRVRMRQHGFDGAAEVDELRREGQALRRGRDARLVAPRGEELLRGGGVRHLEFDEGDVRPRVQTRFLGQAAASLPGVHSHGQTDAADRRIHILPPLPGQPRGGAAAGCLQVLRHRERPRRRGARRHFEARRHDVARDPLREDHADDAGRDQRERQDDGADGAGHDDGGAVGGKPQPPIEGTVGEPPEPPVHARLDPGQAAAHRMARRPLGAGQVREVVRQHQQRFDQRHDDHRDHDDRDRAHDVADAAGQEQERGERRDRREHREDQRALNPLRAADRRARARKPPPALEVDVLGHDDGVVHDDADGKDERERRNGAYRYVEDQHRGQRAQRGDPDPGGHPHRGPGFEEEGEPHQHEEQAERAVLEKKADPFRVDVRVVVPDGDADARRERRPRPMLHVVLDDAGDVEDLLAGGAVHLDERRAPPLVAVDQVRLLESVADGGDVAEPHRGPVAAAQDDDVLEVLLVVAALPGAHAHLTVPGLDAAGRQIDRPGANGGGHVLQGETEGAEPPERHLDRDLAAPHAAGLDVGDARERGNLVLGAVRERLERPLRDIPVENQAHHALAVRHLPDFRAFRAGGKGLDAADRRLDLVDGPAHVRPVRQLRHDRRHTLRRHRRDLLHAIERRYPLLDLDDDRLLDLARRGAGVAHRHFDSIEGQDRKRFLHQTGERHHPRRHDEEHQQVGGDAVPHHVGDGAARFPRRRVRRAHEPPPASVRTAMPSLAIRIPPTTTAAPPSRAPVTYTSSSARCRTRTETMVTAPSRTSQTSLPGRSADLRTLKYSTGATPSISTSTNMPTSSGGPPCVPMPATAPLPACAFAVARRRAAGEGRRNPHDDVERPRLLVERGLDAVHVPPPRVAPAAVFRDDPGGDPPVFFAGPQPPEIRQQRGGRVGQRHHDVHGIGSVEPPHALTGGHELPHVERLDAHHTVERGPDLRARQHQFGLRQRGFVPVQNRSGRLELRLPERQRARVHRGLAAGTTAPERLVLRARDARLFPHPQELHLLHGDVRPRLLHPAAVFGVVDAEDRLSLTDPAAALKGGLHPHDPAADLRPRRRPRRAAARSPPRARG